MFDFNLSPYRNSSSRERGERSDRSDRADRGLDRRDDRERNRPQGAATRSFSREKEEQSRERERRGSADPVRKVANMTDDRDRGGKERTQSRENGIRPDFYCRIHTPMCHHSHFRQHDFSSVPGHYILVLF